MSAIIWLEFALVGAVGLALMSGMAWVCIALMDWLGDD